MTTRICNGDWSDDLDHYWWICWPIVAVFVLALPVIWYGGNWLIRRASGEPEAKTWTILDVMYILCSWRGE